jgi:hypothetical protein
MVFKKVSVAVGALGADGCLNIAYKMSLKV